MVGPAIFFNILLFYFLPGIFALRALYILLTTQNPVRKRKATISLVALVALLTFFAYNSYRVDNDWEQRALGIYQLTSYPNCPACVLELREENVFVVRHYNSIRETGHWRFESGQDYWITYLNEHDQLGSGKYRYTKYHLKYPQL